MKTSKTIQQSYLQLKYLAFVPPQHVEDIYERIVLECDSQEMDLFFTYYKRTYFNFRYAIIDWNIFYNLDRDTKNNVLERYIRNVSDDFIKKPGFYTFLK